MTSQDYVSNPTNVLLVTLLKWGFPNKDNKQNASEYGISSHFKKVKDGKQTICLPKLKESGTRKTSTKISEQNERMQNNMQTVSTHFLAETERIKQLKHKHS